VTPIAAAMFAYLLLTILVIISDANFGITNAKEQNAETSARYQRHYPSESKSPQ
jgi:hypothetical protein